MNNDLCSVGVDTQLGAEADLDVGMVDSIDIKNFRCFESARMDGCRTINVMLGRNASGKTALLEALFLAAGNTPEIAQRLRTFRGITNLSSLNVEIDKLQWADLFYNYDVKNKIEIKLLEKKHRQRSLVVSYDEDAGFSPVSTAPGAAAVLASPVKFEYTKSTGREVVVRMGLTGGILTPLGLDSGPLPCAFFPANFTTDSNETVDRFSKLSIDRSVDDIIKEMSKEFDFIKDIEVGVRALQSGLYIDIRGVKQKIILGLVSGGVNKIINILLAISSMKGGIIIVDEIDNGIYYDRLEAYWAAIYSFAKKNEVQIFASTHSVECLEALSRASNMWADQVAFFRTAQADDGKKKVESFASATMFRALEIGEVR